MDSFNQRKKDVLSKEDKSSIGEWDRRVLKVCERINSLKNYYTTSSCSGRIMVVREGEQKGPGAFEFFSHDKVSVEKFLEAVENLREGDFSFRQEAVIFHVACLDLESAKDLMEKALHSGFKRSGIISVGKNIVVEINSTERIEFPLIKEGILLVEDDFLREVLEKANLNLEKGWEKIERLEKFYG